MSGWASVLIVIAVVKEMLAKHEVFRTVIVQQFLVIAALGDKVFTLEAQKNLKLSAVLLLRIAHFIDVVPDFRHIHAIAEIPMGIRHMITHAQYVKMLLNGLQYIIFHGSLRVFAAETVGMIIGKHTDSSVRVE